MKKNNTVSLDLKEVAIKVAKAAFKTLRKDLIKEYSNYKKKIKSNQNDLSDLINISLMTMITIDLLLITYLKHMVKEADETDLDVKLFHDVFIKNLSDVIKKSFILQ